MSCSSTRKPSSSRSEVSVDGPAEPVVPGKDGTPHARAPVRAGRNLPAALGVGVALGGPAIVTLFTLIATFLIYLAAALAMALWEPSRSIRAPTITQPSLPGAPGGTAALAQG